MINANGDDDDDDDDNEKTIVLYASIRDLKLGFSFRYFDKI